MERAPSGGGLTVVDGLEPDAGERSGASGTIRILCYNVRHCRGMHTPFISERRIAQVICDARPDIAGLAEVFHTRAHDQPERLSRLTDLEPRFYGVRPIRGGDYGNLVLSRFPMREVARIPLDGRFEARGCLLVEVESDLGVVTVGMTHLGLDYRSRRAQMAALLEALPHDRPLILMGDFNSTIRELAPLFAAFGTVPDPPPTFPSVRPILPLDHIMFSRHFAPRGVRVPDSLASDHRPLLVELALAR